jgi:AcrR family transcriptional regulator
VATPETPSRRETRRRRELAGRRADAIAGALAVFGTKGFHDAQMTEIAAAAELSLASLYSMFTGKEEIYREVIRSAAEDMSRAILERLEPVTDLGERPLRLIDALFECFEENHDLLRILLSGTQGLPWRIRARTADSGRDVVDEFTNRVIALCREASDAGKLAGLDPDAFASSLIGAVSNAAARAIDEDPQQPLTRLAPGIRAVFARALVPEDGA